MAKMTDVELRAVLQSRINNSIGSRPGGQSDQISQDRSKALRYYRGDPFGNEQEGRSQVVSRDVAEAVDSIMPSLVRVFASGEEVVRFEPFGQEDEEAAQQQTDYVNYLFAQRNAGFTVLYDWMKAALLFRLSFAKVWWDESEEVSVERYSGLTEPEVQALYADGVEVEDQEQDGQLVLDDGATIPRS